MVRLVCAICFLLVVTVLTSVLLKVLLLMLCMWFALTFLSIVVHVGPVNCLAVRVRVQIVVSVGAMVSRLVMILRNRSRIGLRLMLLWVRLWVGVMTRVSGS